MIESNAHMVVGEFGKDDHRSW